MLSTFTWILILLLLIIVKHIYVLPQEDKQLFELYAVRDEISIAAMKGEISQDTKEYEFVVDNINFWIYNTRNDYDFSVVFRNILSIAKMKKKALDKLLEKINDSPILKKGFTQIGIQRKRIMRIKGMLFLSVAVVSLNVCLIVVNSIVEVCNVGHRTVEYLSHELSKSKNMKNQYDYYTKQTMLNKV